MSWETVVDDEGRTYYYNSETHETSWTNPEASEGSWKVYQNDDGREYYYNEVTQVTTWEIPEELKRDNKKETVIDGEEEQSLDTEVIREDVVVDSTEDGEHIDKNNSIDTGVQKETSESTRGESVVVEVEESSVDNVLSTKPVEDSILLSHSPSTPEEANAAFKSLLKSFKVDSTWSFQKVMSELINEPGYWSIPDSLQRKALYDEYLIERIKNELTNKSSIIETFEANFMELLSDYQKKGVLKYNTRWLTIKSKLIEEDNSIYKHSILSDKEIWESFNKFTTKLKDAHEKELNDQRLQALSELESYLVNNGNYSNSSSWEVLYERLIIDPRFIANKHFNILTSVDILQLYKSKIYPNVISELKGKVEKISKQNYRSDRKAREDFKKLLLLLDLNINSNTTFQKIFPVLEGEDTFIEICGRDGSTPMELFWDVVDEKYQSMKLKKDIIENELRRNFEFKSVVTGSKEDFIKIIKNDLNNETITKLEDEELDEIWESLARDVKIEQQQFEKKREVAVVACGSWLVNEYINKPDSMIAVITSETHESEGVEGKITFTEKDGKYALSDNYIDFVPKFMVHVEGAHPYKHLRKVMSSNFVSNPELESEYSKSLIGTLQSLASLLENRKEQEKIVKRENPKKRSMEYDNEKPLKKKHVVLNY